MIVFRFLSSWLYALAILQLVGAEDTVGSGNYLIHLCNSLQRDSRASKLQSLIPQVYDGLQKVIADLRLDTPSLHGYNAIFKTASSKDEVLEVYEKMAAGASVLVGQNHNVMRHPTFICANKDSQTDLLYQYCEAQPEVAVMNWKTTELIPVCPYFWEFKEQPVFSDCPLVVANTLTPNDDRLLANQEALIVGVLVHLYHRLAGHPITTMTDASELNPSSSLLNAPSYAFYYAAVQAGCINFPNMQEPHDELRRLLLEVPDNSSDANINSPIFDLPSSVPVPPDLDTLQNFCNDAVYAPNGTVCCDESTGLWVPAPVIRDSPAATMMSASCPQKTGGTGGLGAGSGVINTRRRRTVNAL